MSIAGTTPSSTISLPSGEMFPALSSAVAVTTSPSFKLPGFGTDQCPALSACTTTIVPSGNLTVTSEFGSALPVISEFVGLIGSISGVAITVSTSNSSAGDLGLSTPLIV